MITLGSDYEREFTALISGYVGKEREGLSAGWPAIGEEYVPGEGLLVIGRAINGLEEEHQLVSGDVVTGVRRFAESLGMAWLRCPANTKGYNSRRSSYWRVIEAVSRRVHPPSERWWGHRVAWSNLYKVAPTAGGNPRGEGRRRQEAAAIALMRLELNKLRPARVLAITGLDWLHPFAVGLGLDLVPVTGSSVLATATSGFSRWVVTCRPERRPEGPFIEETVLAFGA